MCWSEVLALFLGAGSLLAIADFYRGRAEQGHNVSLLERLLVAIAYLAVIASVLGILMLSEAR